MQQNRYVLYSSRQPTSRIVAVRKKGEPGHGSFLMHHGISGQKWGERRFQNEDGTLTEAGKQRYRKEKAESENWKKSDAEHLSDDELRRRNTRLQAERQYKDLTTSEIERERKQRKKEIINKVIVGTAVSLAAVAMRGHYKQAASFIGTYGKRALAKIRTSGLIKKAISNAPNAYTKSRITIPQRDIMSRYIRKTKRTYNYWPRAKGGVPRNVKWPNL